MPVTALVTPGPEVTRATPTLPVRARVAIRGMDRSLLVAHQDVLELLLLVELVVDVQHRAAGIAPDVFDAFFGECVTENFRTDDFGCGR